MRKGLILLMVFIISAQQSFAYVAESIDITNQPDGVSILSSYYSAVNPAVQESQIGGFIGGQSENIQVKNKGGSGIRFVSFLASSVGKGEDVVLEEVADVQPSSSSGGSSSSGAVSVVVEKELIDDGFVVSEPMVEDVEEVIEDVRQEEDNVIEEKKVVSIISILDELKLKIEEKRQELLGEEEVIDEKDLDKKPEDANNNIEQKKYPEIEQKESPVIVEDKDGLKDIETQEEVHLAAEEEEVLHASANTMYSFPWWLVLLIIAIFISIYKYSHHDQNHKKLFIIRRIRRK